MINRTRPPHLLGRHLEALESRDVPADGPPLSFPDVADRFEKVNISSVTAVTHGSQLFGDGDALEPVTTALRQRFERAGKTVFVVDIDVRDGKPFIDSNWPLPQKNDTRSAEVIVQADWSHASNESSAGWTAAAGDGLFVALADLNLVRLAHGTTNPRYHFIGHSFGAGVNSEAVRRLGAYGVLVDHVTNLDPHDFDQAFLPVDGEQQQFTLGVPRGYGVTTWDNVTFSDTYYQTRGRNAAALHDAPLVPLGRPIPGTYNVRLDSNDLPAYYAGTDVAANFGGDHTAVWSDFYIRSIYDEDATTGYGFNWQREEMRPEPRFWSDQDHRNTPSYIYNHAEKGPNVEGLAAVNLDPAKLIRHRGVPRLNPLAIINGDFTNSGEVFGTVPGWSYHGGGGTGYVVNDGGDGRLELTGRNPSRTHNTVVIPPDASGLTFDAQVVGVAPGDRLRVSVGKFTTEFAIESGIGGDFRRFIAPFPIHATAWTATIVVQLVSSDSVVGSVMRLDNFELLGPAPAQTTAPMPAAVRQSLAAGRRHAAAPFAKAVAGSLVLPGVVPLAPDLSGLLGGEAGITAAIAPASKPDPAPDFQAAASTVAAVSMADVRADLEADGFIVDIQLSDAALAALPPDSAEVYIQATRKIRLDAAAVVALRGGGLGEADLAALGLSGQLSAAGDLELTVTVGVDRNGFFIRGGDLLAGSATVRGTAAAAVGVIGSADGTAVVRVEPRAQLAGGPGAKWRVDGLIAAGDSLLTTTVTGTADLTLTVAVRPFLAHELRFDGAWHWDFSDAGVGPQTGPGFGLAAFADALVASGLQDLWESAGTVAGLFRGVPLAGRDFGRIAAELLVRELDPAQLAGPVRESLAALGIEVTTVVTPWDILSGAYVGRDLFTARLRRTVSPATVALSAGGATTFDAAGVPLTLDATGTFAAVPTLTIDIGFGAGPDGFYLEENSSIRAAVTAVGSVTGSVTVGRLLGVEVVGAASLDVHAAATFNDADDVLNERLPLEGVVLGNFLNQADNVTLTGRLALDRLSMTLLNPAARIPVVGDLFPALTWTASLGHDLGTGQITYDVDLATLPTFASLKDAIYRRLLAEIVKSNPIPESVRKLLSTKVSFLGDQTLLELAGLRVAGPFLTPDDYAAANPVSAADGDGVQWHFALDDPAAMLALVSGRPTDLFTVSFDRDFRSSLGTIPVVPPTPLFSFFGLINVDGSLSVRPELSLGVHVRAGLDTDGLFVVGGDRPIFTVGGGVTVQVVLNGRLTVVPVARVTIGAGLTLTGGVTVRSPRPGDPKVRIDDLFAGGRPLSHVLGVDLRVDLGLHVRGEVGLVGTDLVSAASKDKTFPIFRVSAGTSQPGDDAFADIRDAMREKGKELSLIGAVAFPLLLPIMYWDDARVVVEKTVAAAGEALDDMGEELSRVADTVESLGRSVGRAAEDARRAFDQNVVQPLRDGVRNLVRHVLGGSVAEEIFGGDWRAVDVPELYTFSARFDAASGHLSVYASPHTAAHFVISVVGDLIVVDGDDWVQTRALVARRERSGGRTDKKRYEDVLQPNVFRMPRAAVRSIGFVGTDHDDMVVVRDGVDEAGRPVPFTVPVDVALHDGNDTAVGGGGNDRMEGRAGNDYIYGGGGNDTLGGDEDGDDTLVGGPGDDSSAGGAGNDVLIESGDAGRNTLDGGPGEDRLFGGGGPDALAGGAGRDSLQGGQGADTLTGDTGADPEAGDADTLAGGLGDDVLFGGGGANVLAGEDGDDTVTGGAVADAITGGPGRDSLDGREGPDTVIGGDGADTVIGGDGKNMLVGNQPDGTSADGDVITGGADNDTILGATGVDTIIGGGAADVIDAGGGNDVVTAGSADAAAGRPAIEFTQVPAIGNFDVIRGVVHHAAPGQFVVAVFIHVIGRWWPKPTFNEPLTPILPDGSFAVDYTTGGVDEQATRVAAFLLPAEFVMPDNAAGADFPPSVLEAEVARLIVTRDALGSGGRPTVINGGVGDDRVSVADGTPAAPDLAAAVGAGGPVVEITRAPGGGHWDLAGRVHNADPARFFVAAFTQVFGRWYTKPLYDEPLTAVRPDGTWQVAANTGVFDTRATALRVYLVPAGYTPPLAIGQTALPAELAVHSVATDFVSLNQNGAVIVGGAGADTLTGSSRDDSMDGGLDDDRLEGGGGADRLFVTAGQDTVLGQTGNDTVSVTAGPAVTATIDGGAGPDTLFVSGAGLVSELNVEAVRVLHDGMSADVAGPALAGVPREMTVVRGELVAFTAANPHAPGGVTYTLVGAPAGAVIDPVTGALTWVPPAAAGTYSFAVRVADAHDSAVAATAAVHVTIAATALRNGILLVAGSAGHDIVAVNAVSGGAKLEVKINGAVAGLFDTAAVKRLDVRLLAGNDRLAVGAAVAVPLTVDGGADNDTLSGGSRAADKFVFVGDWGVDQMTGVGTGDTVDFTAVPAGVAVTLAATTTAASGANRLTAPAGLAAVLFGTGANLLTGGPSANTFTLSGRGAGTLNATRFIGVFSLAGGAGNDVLKVLPGGSLAGRFDGGLGRNAVDYAAWPTDVTVNLLLGTATGLGGVAKVVDVTGGQGSDLIVGNADANRLSGEVGRDVLVGGGGADTLTGGADDDVLVAALTAFDGYAAGFAVILLNWRAVTPYADRVTALSGGEAGGDVLNRSSVTDDAKARDSLTGGTGTDWFITGTGDWVTDAAGEIRLTV